MAPRRTSRGRKAPRRKQNRFLFQGRWWKIVYPKGYELRHMNPDLDVMLWLGDGHQEFVPPGELWLDRRYRPETKRFLEVFRIEKMRKWTTKGDNDRYPPYKRLREELKEKLCRKGPAPDFVVRRCSQLEYLQEILSDPKIAPALKHEFRKILGDPSNQHEIVFVRGDLVRLHRDPHFVLGGHDLVYPTYIEGPRSIWADVCQDPREIKFTVVHEVVERKDMSRGWRYGPAHAHAIKVETKLRALEYVALDKEDIPVQTKPLNVIPIEQSDTGCGPTSLKMMLDYDRVLKVDGTPYSEDELIALCGCDPETGTDHAPLVIGARNVAGERVVHGDGGTIDDLRRVVLTERRPVMVGWWLGPHRTSEEVRADPELDGGHYSVVMHVSRTHVWLADSWIIPEDESMAAPGIRKLRVKEFLERWYDMDGSPTDSDPGYHVVRGWYLYLRAPDQAEPKP